MRAVDLIRKKRDGGSLSPAEISWLVGGIATGEVADYQWSALLMAIFFRGMDRQEAVALTRAMTESGSGLDLSGIPGPKIDKHSTGGVGDKTSLILAPIAAAAGVIVPKVSGRGLGHTGGTLDKLESIPGFRVSLDVRRSREVLARCGMMLIGQTAEIAPADKVLYALRDATATVESLPLITASIMSKKLAEGIDGLVLDVKTGDGALLQEREQSVQLARAMLEIGQAVGKRVVAFVTRMDQPLGRAVGNATEVAEAIACLKGEGPADLVELSLELAAAMVVLGDRASSMEEARALCRSLIAEGRAIERLRRLIEAQHGDPRVVDDPSRLPQPRREIEVPSPRGGIVQKLGARAIGQATMLLGAGRERVDSTIDPAVGIVLRKKVGDDVAPGEPLCTLLVNDERYVAEATRMVIDAYSIAESPVPAEPLIVTRLE